MEQAIQNDFYIGEAPKLGPPDIPGFYLSICSYFQTLKSSKLVMSPRFGNKLRKSGFDFRWLLNGNFLLCNKNIMSDFFLFLLLFFPHFFLSKILSGLCQRSDCNTDQVQLMLIHCMYYIITEPMTWQTFLSSLLPISDFVLDEIFRRNVPAKRFKRGTELLPGLIFAKINFFIFRDMV